MDTFTKIINGIPQKINNRITPPGPVSGNGDISVIFGNDDNNLILYVSKCDFWKLSDGGNSDGGIKSVCKIKINDMDFSDYYAEQRMKSGSVYGKFGNREITVFTSPDNTIYVELTADDTDVFPSVETDVSDDGNSKIFTCTEKSYKWYLKKYDGYSVIHETDAAICQRRLSTVRKDGRKTVRYCISVVTNFDTEHYTEKCIEQSINADYDRDKLLTEQKWNDFWNKSDVVLFDKKIELYYHGSLYLLACCCGNTKFPPGLFGNFVTDDDFPWHGDYHLNYNYQAPFYCLCSSNHPELTDSYLTPLYDHMEKGKKYAEEYLGCKGIYYPVGIGPMGTDTSSMKDSLEHGKLFLGQKSNAAYSAVIPVMRWYATYDKNYAEKAYPYIRAVGDFWESYLKKENGRYVIENDAVHEVPYYRGKDFKESRYKKQIHAKNNVLSLGLVHMIFRCLIDMSETLGTDKDKLPAWKDIEENLSDFPTFIKKGKRCYRYTEKGISWVNGNSVGIQHIFPASAIDLSSDKRTLKTARNTYFINDRRLDDNGSCSYIPCGARLGVKPEFLLDGIRMNIEKFALSNMLFAHGGGCIEHLTTIPSTVNEMLMQSHEKVIRLFPCWDRKNSAEFRDLRADGAFLVSAKLKKQKISDVIIKSEKGRDCTLDVADIQKVTVTTPNGEKVKYKKDGTFITFKTSPDGIYFIK